MTQLNNHATTILRLQIIILIQMYLIRWNIITIQWASITKHTDNEWFVGWDQINETKKLTTIKISQRS